MKLSQEINDAINVQIQHEFLNMLKYKVIESYFQDMRLINLANRFKAQSNEEYEHASKFIDYLNKRIGGKVSIEEIPKPNLTINSVQDVANIYLETEQGTTESIESIYSLICEENSEMDRGFISEMLNIQVTEEDEADEFMKKVALVKDIVLFDATYEG